MGTMRKREVLRRRSRGAGVLEFTLLMPILLYMLLLPWDLATISMAQSSMYANVDQASRAGAQAGGACPAGNCSTGPAGQAFTESLRHMPMSNSVTDTKFLVQSGKICSATDPADKYVTTKATYKVKLISPMLGMFLGGSLADIQEVDGSVTAVARCEVSRS